MALLIAGCSLLGGEDFERVDLTEHRQIWEENGPSNYQYDLQVECFCLPWPYPARIVVRDDSVHAVLDPETGDTLRAPESGEPALTELPDAYRSVESLFDVVQRALDEDYHRLRVEYNDGLGYPFEIDFDVSEDTVDDEVEYNISNFEVE